MDWRGLRDWPLSERSRQIIGPVHRWHVQEHGEGDTVLFLHGAGGSTHSWRGMLAGLKDMHCVALDLPGHGFTKLGARHRSGLQAISADIAALLDQENWHPKTIVAHSAGAAIALDLAQHHLSPEVNIFAINPALAGFEGPAGVMFPVLAKALAMTPFTAAFFARSASATRVAALIRSTGSTLSPEGLALYQRLISDRDHVNGALLMMSQWDLDPLIRDLEQIQTRTTFVVGAQDGTVPPKVAQSAAERMPNAQLVTLEHLGHLAHEEEPNRLNQLLEAHMSTASCTG